MSRPFVAALSIVTLFLSVPASLPAQSSTSLDAAYQQLAQSFKPVLASALPTTLYHQSENWGHQVSVPVGLKWKGVKPAVSKSPRNHGQWRRLFITTHEPKRTLDMRIYDVKSAGADKHTFKLFLTFQMGVELEQQNWESGLRLWSGSVRARTQVKAEMLCENTLKINVDKNGLPDVTLRLRVLDAKCSYDRPVIEHINGIGGDGAKIIGGAVYDMMKTLRPSVERELLAKANAAIVKTADTREIRIGFGSLLKSK